MANRPQHYRRYGAPMDCERTREHLEAYALDALEPAERAEIERHLVTCAECREIADALAETVAQFPAALATASPVVPPGDLRDRLLRAVAAHTALSHREIPNSERERSGTHRQTSVAARRW